MLLDSVLEPVWVWVAGLDTPPLYSLYAGSVVIFVLIVNATLALLEEAETAVKNDIDGDKNDYAGSGDGGWGGRRRKDSVSEPLLSHR